MSGYVPYPMVLNGVYIGIVDLRQDQINYFGIPAATTAENAFLKYSKQKEAYSRKIYSQRLDSLTSTKTVQVEKGSRKSKDRTKITRGRGGKPIKIPTELRSVPATTGTTINLGTTRTTVIKFPGDADLSEISAWLFVKLVSKKPKYMVSPSGQSHPVTGLAAGTTVTGQDTTP